MATWPDSIASRKWSDIPRFVTKRQVAHFIRKGWQRVSYGTDVVSEAMHERYNLTPVDGQFLRAPKDEYGFTFVTRVL